jgi:hypothetical protein
MLLLLQKLFADIFFFFHVLLKCKENDNGTKKKTLCIAIEMKRIEIKIEKIILEA